jgi:hypothetical protein
VGSSTSLSGEEEKQADNFLNDEGWGRPPPLKGRKKSKLIKIIE